MRCALAGSAALVIVACAQSSFHADTPPDAIVSDCDRQTAYINDEGRVAPAVARANIDVPRAIAACEAAILQDPGNGRLHYQLARVLGYDGQITRARTEREIAAEAGYPAALFLLGILDAFNSEGDADTVCQGANYMERAVEKGAFVALAAYPAYRAEGIFDHCEGLASRQDLFTMLDRAEPMADGYYKSMLVRTARAALTQ